MASEKKELKVHNEQMRINNLLALSRTGMSVERTMLAFIRTALTFSAAGLSFIQFFDHISNKIFGVFLILAGIISLIYGYVKYRRMKQIIGSSTLKLKELKRLEDVF